MTEVASHMKVLRDSAIMSDKSEARGGVPGVCGWSICYQFVATKDRLVRRSAYGKRDGGR